MTHEAGGRVALQGHPKIVALAFHDHFYSSFCESQGRLHGGTSRAHGHMPVRLRELLPSEFLLHVQLAKLCFPAVSLIQTCRSQWMKGQVQRGPGTQIAVGHFTPEAVLSLSLCPVLQARGDLFRSRRQQPLCSPHVNACANTPTSCSV